MFLGFFILVYVFLLLKSFNTTSGHYALVMKVLVPQPPNPSPEAAEGEEDGGGGRVATWKVAVGSSIGGVLGIVLLGLLMVAMFGKVKKKAKMVELERKAYEEEALHMFMVGHVRAPLTSSTHYRRRMQRRKEEKGIDLGFP
ncbi:hypothetical protein LINPERHAP2_LOCUS320 [Linum perenne]